MYGQMASGSLLWHLWRVPDPRSRRGRRYPLGGLLGMLLLAALNGEKSLRGMWLWGCQHWRRISTSLGFWGNPRPPVYTALWYVLREVEPEAVEAAFQDWLASWPAEQPQRVSIDGKVLRGSRRTQTDEAALEVVAAVGQELQVALGQREVVGGNPIDAALALLRAMPLEGKLVVADAGLLCRSVAKTVVAEGGDYLGLVKDNQPALKQALEEWMTPDLFPPEPRTPGR